MFLLVLFFGLDVRDLYFKIAWLGPYDAYAFSAVGQMRIENEVMSLVTRLPSPGEMRSSASGWSSFLHKCDRLQGSGFFLEVVGRNCSVGDPVQPSKVDNLLMSSAIRVDSVAWACCKLLRLHRRPSICQERMVTHFSRRYKIEETSVPTAAMAQVDSASERELIGLLEVISRSAPSYKVVCVQAFAFFGEGKYLPTIFGCGNPIVYESAFAGVSAAYLQELLQDKSWLTCDILSVMMLQFMIRQNSRSSFVMRNSTDGVMAGEHRTSINFSASGQLYALVVIIDVFLATLHVLSGIEILRCVLLPVLRSGIDQGQGDFRGDKSCFSIFSRSLCRCRPVVTLTTLTHLISWQIILPNAVVWTWSSSRRGKLLAYMSSIRVWVLLLITFQSLWDAFVLVSERWTYAFARQTYLTTAELMAIGAAVAFLNRADLFSMGEKKYAIDHQRLVDPSSFESGAVGFANAYSDDKDGCGIARGRLSTSLDVLRIVYEPLLRILARSILSIFGYLLLKLGYIHSRRQVITPAQLTTQHPKRHTRLPIEVLLRIPVRARSIIRSSSELDVVIGGSVFVPESLLFDFGLLLDKKADVVFSRVGFFGEVVPPLIELGDHTASRDASGRLHAPTGIGGPTVSFTTTYLAKPKTMLLEQ